MSSSQLTFNFFRREAQPPTSYMIRFWIDLLDWLDWLDWLDDEQRNFRIGLWASTAWFFFNTQNQERIRITFHSHMHPRYCLHNYGKFRCEIILVQLWGCAAITVHKHLLILVTDASLCWFWTLRRDACTLQIVLLLKHTVTTKKDRAVIYIYCI